MLLKKPALRPGIYFGAEPAEPWPCFAGVRKKDAKKTEKDLKTVEKVPDRGYHDKQRHIKLGKGTRVYEQKRMEAAHGL